MLVPVVWIMLAFGAPQANGDTVSVASLLEAHESSLGLVHEIELTLNLTAERFQPDHAGPTDLGSWQWAWKGPLERVRYLRGPDHRGDVFYDRVTTRELLNWDPEHPPTITPRKQLTVRAKILPRSRVIVGRDARVALLWSFSGLIGEPIRYSLRELIAECAPPATFVGVTDINGHACYHVHASVPSPKGKAFGHTSFDIFFDPSVGFLARRVDVEVRAVEATKQDVGRRDALYQHVVRDVLEFKACAGGVFVPTKVELRNYNEGEKANPFSRVLFTAKDLVVNQALSRDAFAFRFPENALVIHVPETQGSRRKVELWGRDDKPVKEIKSPADLPPWTASLSEGHAGKRGGRAWLTSGAVVLLLISLVALWFRRRLRSPQGN